MDSYQHGRGQGRLPATQGPQVSGLRRTSDAADMESRGPPDVRSARQPATMADAHRPLAQLEELRGSSQGTNSGDLSWMARTAWSGDYGPLPPTPTNTWSPAGAPERAGAAWLGPYDSTQQGRLPDLRQPVQSANVPRVMERGPMYSTSAPLPTRLLPQQLERDVLVRDLNPQGGLTLDSTGRLPYATSEPQPRHRGSSRDEFSGPVQYLDPPSDVYQELDEDQLVQLKVSLQPDEQDEVLNKVNSRLCRCAYDFIAKYRFPIPYDTGKWRPVTSPESREWTEWCELLQRLATKRRIPVRVLWKGQIRQLTTILDNSKEMRHAAMHQSRPLKDDRNILQLVSAGLQVAKILKDPDAMRFLDELYSDTERKIQGKGS